MEDFRRCLERQERETNERSHRQDEINMLHREEDEQVVITMALLDEENQGRRRGSQVSHRRNVDRHSHSRGKNLLEDYFNPTSLYYDVDFRRRYRMQPHLFNKVMHDIFNYDAYFVQKCDAAGVLGLLPEQKFTVVIRMLAYGSSADQVDEIAQMGKSTTLVALVRFCDAVETLCTRDYLRIGMAKIPAGAGPRRVPDPNGGDFGAKWLSGMEISELKKSPTGMGRGWYWRPHPRIRPENIYVYI
ncbi:hypothetical protein L3X38_013003 [Prunus dulcis]|uniref:Uncharacterized protein n=1 Tax=Prunus dulcis TaxID=3755 RepID=A0AAD4ZGX5_PRUDU|nr:hypothetical protein L3X38_013003 [Prunus dulcis]